MMTGFGFDKAEVLTHAKVAALWSSHDDNDEYLDSAGFNTDDITGEAEEKLIKLIGDFLAAAGGLLDSYPMGEEQLGHDLILTVNHHGTGFWDRPALNKTGLGASLAGVCRNLPSYDLYVGDDGKLYA